LVVTPSRTLKSKLALLELILEMHVPGIAVVAKQTTTVDIQ